MPDHTIAQVSQRLDHLVHTFEHHPDPRVRAGVLELLELVDTLHRSGLQRLVSTLQACAPLQYEELLDDPAVQALLLLYDLAPLSPVEQAELALEQVRPYVASHGGAIEVVDVIDGVVHVQLRGSCRGCAGSEMTLRQLVETTLREQMPEVRGVEAHSAPPLPGGFIPLEAVQPGAPALRRPVFTPVLALDDLAPATPVGVEVEGISILLCRIGDAVSAYRNACSASILPLHIGRLEGTTLHCPWHGCRYDMRTGKRLDADAQGLEVLPVAVQAGMIQVALNVAPVALSAPRGD